MTALALRSSEPRRAASPYARRLARERQVTLEAVRGSGPLGRIVAADVLAWVPAVEPEPAAVPTPAPAAKPIAAFAVSIDLSRLREFMAQADAAEIALTLEDIALRAARRALDAAGLNEAAMVLEADGRQIRIEAGSGHSARRYRRDRLEALVSGVDDAAGVALLSLQVTEAVRVRSLIMPLLPGRALRLRLGASDRAAEALLCADPAQIGEDAAVALLEAFAEGLEQPLVLLA